MAGRYLMSKNGQWSEIDYRASLRAPSLPADSVGFEDRSRRPIQTESNIDRLVRTMCETTRCSWFDRDTRYVTFWVDLSETFGMDYHPEEDGHPFRIIVRGPKVTFALTTNRGNQHETKICFVHKSTFHIRTNLPDALLDMLKRVNDGSVKLSLVLRRKNASSRRREPSEFVLPIERATGPVVF